MEPIAHVGLNAHHPAQVLAQSIAAVAGWQWGPGAQIFDAKGVWVADSLTDLAAVMQEQTDWVTGPGTAASGVNWRALPHQEQDPSQFDAHEITKAIQAATRRSQERPPPVVSITD